jgi:hypothetical protein
MQFLFSPLMSLMHLFPQRLPFPWLVYAIVFGTVQVNSSGMACSIMILFGRYLCSFISSLILPLHLFMSLLLIGRVFLLVFSSCDVTWHCSLASLCFCCFCLILLDLVSWLTVMLLFVILTIAIFKWKLNIGLAIVMFFLYFVFMVVSLLLEKGVIKCAMTIWRNPN